MARKLRIALAGNANVGKSVVFNQLTGLHQHVGNWPGKTVEKAEGTLYFKGYEIDIVDLPGIYSLSTFSLEEEVAREYIATEKPDVVINIVDASVLERNLFFTLQLMELGAPMVIGLNQIDLAEKKGIHVDFRRLEEALGIPVVPTVAIRGQGVYELLQKSVESVEEGKSKPSTIRYGEEVEERIEKITGLVEDVKFRFPARWTAIKLLEGDERVEEEIRRLDPSVMDTVTRLSKEIEEIHGHSCPTVITSERYDAAARISLEVQSVTSKVKTTARERLHTITTSRISGYPIMVLVIIGIFEFIFTFGNFMSQLLSNLFYSLEPSVEVFLGTGLLKNLVWGGIAEGLIASVSVALPYIAPFYFILHILEDSGYMSRIAFLMDSFMHKIGLHGKAFIPIMLGYGCTVPACLGCRILETRRERLIAVFVVTMIPCAARTVIILGLVGAFVGIWWAIALYAFNLIVVFLLGRLAFKALPGEPTALIMEMSEYKLPHLKTVGEMTWFDLKEFVKISFPLIIVGSLVLKALEAFNLLAPIAEILSPVTVSWLQLPLITGVALIFGVLRKELTLVMLATLAGTTNFSLVLTPVQMVVFTLVVMFYVPCVATITALVKETGYKKAFLVTVFEIAFALLIGGLASRILTILGVP